MKCARKEIVDAAIADAQNRLAPLRAALDQAERHLKTLKYEEVPVNDYEHVEDPRASMGHFLEEVYNHKRLHSALGYGPLVEFETALQRSTSPQRPVSF